MILDPRQVKERKQRSQAAVLNAVYQLANGSPGPVIRFVDIVRESKLSEQDAEDAVNALKVSGHFLPTFGGDCSLTPDGVSAMEG